MNETFTLRHSLYGTQFPQKCLTFSIQLQMQKLLFLLNSFFTIQLTIMHLRSNKHQKLRPAKTVPQCHEIQKSMEQKFC